MEIIGHKKQRDFLKKAAEKGKLPHAYLFSGQEKLGKKRIAMEVASLILKTDLSKTQHPDFMMLQPLEGEIKIEQIRDLIFWLSLKSFSGSYKVALIDQAHLMNFSAQTAFLKTLEEPKGKTLIILISKTAEHFLPTILSRVEIMKFLPLSRKELEQGFEGARNLDEIIDISLGRPGLVAEYIADSKKLEEFRERVQKLEKMVRSDYSLKFQIAKDLSENVEEMDASLDAWLIHFRNAFLKMLSSGEAFLGYSLKKIANIIASMQKTRFLLSTTNASPRLALETLMLEL
jgi:DNA polymerase-3 subunit delta'